MLPYELAAAARNAAIATKVRKLQVIGMVAAGYGGDMEDDTVDDILDDMDFDRNSKVCSHVIELMMPQLNELVKRERIY